ncbi:MAG TPA: imidazole glycerol phosphate synthase subunit HisH [Pseudoclavibacter sp.]|nr:imidazole glycerol phosphate synthase subunit HisH [Pseudoclavibacter sp.]
MNQPTVVVLDYGSGNVHSAVKALQAAEADVTLTKDPDAVMAADGLVVPGVGAFGAVMGALRDSGAVPLIERRLAGGQPVLGICVGMQVMFDRGIERGVDTPGLGQWPGVVEQLSGRPLPHMGWNTVDPGQGSILFKGIERERFYFVHSYGVTQWTLKDTGVLPAPVVTWAEHGGQRFVAAAENGPLSATQFHPEKSGTAGIALLANWLRSLPQR